MTREDAAGFERARIEDRAERIVAELQAKGLPVTGWRVADDRERVAFQMRLGGGFRAFRVPRALLNRESVEKMVRAYL